MNRSATRSSLGRYAAAMRDAQPLDPDERRALFREAWREHEIVVLRRRDVPAIFWSAVEAMAERIYGKWSQT